MFSCGILCDYMPICVLQRTTTGSRQCWWWTSCCQPTPTSCPSPRPAWGSWSPATSPPELASPWPHECSSPRWGFTHQHSTTALLIEKKEGKKRLLPFPIWSSPQCVFLRGKSVSDSLSNKVIWCSTEDPAYKSAPPLNVLSIACFFCTFLEN